MFEKGKRRERWERLGSVSHGMAKSVLDNRVIAEREKRLLPRSDNPTLGDIWAGYKLTVQTMSRGWCRNVDAYVQRFEKEWGRDTLASDLTTQDVEGFRVAMRAEGKSPATVDRYCAAGRRAWNVHPTRIANPFLVKFFNPRNAICEFLTKEEEQRLLDVARTENPLLYEMLVVALATGFRASNLFGLRRSAVDFEHGRVGTIQKGGDPHVVAVTEDVIRLLSGIPENGTDWFWINPSTGKPYGDLGKTFRNLLRAAGIERRFLWHWLRHTTGSRIVQAGLGLQAAKEHLGHKQISTTLRYAHLDPDYMRRAAKAASPHTVTYSVTTSANRLKRPRKSTGSKE